ncbi:MAG: hypothetical protein KJ006_10735 [Thermoleophilia bacterium]|nr:hypothetical protein [Thermoleophilia bacterium]GIK77649.1 MAG: hypothetical protein BroJett022_13390 [Actinomycetes bacterium]
MNRNGKHPKSRRIVRRQFRLTSDEIMADLLYPAPPPAPRRRKHRR